MPQAQALTAPPFDVDQLKNVVADVLQQAKKQGATSAEVGVGVDAGLSVSVRLGEVETVEFNRDRGISITVYVGQRKGTASTTDIGADAIRSTVKAACDIAKYTTEDAFAGLADPALMAKDIPDLDLDHPWAITAPEAIELAKVCEAAARVHDSRISNSEGATIATHRELQVYGNSHGFLAGYPTTEHSISCSVIAEANGAMERDYWYTLGCDAAELEAAAKVGEQAAARTVRRLGARRLTTRTAPVLFVSELARGLIGHFVAAISGGNLYRKASFLLDHAGKQIFPSFMHIHENPHVKKALGSAPFDGEGVATRARDIITDGILQGYILGSYSARKLGLVTTGNAGGVHNLFVESGEDDFNALVKKMHTGLIVTDLMGHGANIVTGDYSRGAAGFWVENGEIQYPVHEITIAGHLQNMFANIVAVGNDIDVRGTIRCGSILLPQMTIAGE